jgi:hypothetical protein
MFKNLAYILYIISLKDARMLGQELYDDLSTIEFNNRVQVKHCI